MFRNVILQALGAQTDLTPATARIQIRQGDVLLLCSDGLSGKLRNEEIRQIVSDSNQDLGKACQALVAEANDRGGEDNITVVLARFTGEELRSADQDRITVELPVLEEVTPNGGMGGLGGLGGSMDAGPEDEGESPDEKE